MGRAALSLSLLEALARNAHYSSKELAFLCQLSTRHLQREFRRNFQKTPQKWLDEQRLKAATELLIEGMSVKKAALELGFKQTSHFCRQFKSCYRCTASEFIVEHKARKLVSLADNKCRS